MMYFCKKNNFFAIVFTALTACGCTAPNVAYFNDMGNSQTMTVGNDLGIRLQPDDKITIVVKSKDPALSNLFNLTMVNNVTSTRQSGSYYMCSYTVDSHGDIDFPVLGTVHVADYSREEVAKHIKTELMNRNLVNDPVLTVEYANLGFNVIGEVNRPGRYEFDRDHLTILDAISMAGDLTIQGQRQTVFLMRGSGKERTTYRVNLQSGKDLLQSPAFYLQQNDVIYVEPNGYRSRQTTVNGNNVLSASFWISVASLLTSIAVLIFK